VKIAEIFSSGMVLCANRPIRFFGEGEGDVSIVFNSVERCTSASGAWCLEFPPMPYGGPYSVEITLNGEKSVLENVMLGEVYLFSGQSNMELPISETNCPEHLLCENELVRAWSVRGALKGMGWVSAKKDNMKGWSAIALLASLSLSRERGIAVGAIIAAQGASIIESWIPEGALYGIGIDIPIEKKSLSHSYPPYAKWNRDGILWNSAIKPLTPFSLSGVVWYQGESDSSRAESEVYLDELKLLISEWRKAFCNTLLPFTVVQIADLFEPDRDTVAWRGIQEAQLAVSRDAEKVFTVISADVCENDCIHPPTKHVLAERVADVLKKL
jgi:sialate O-acetylesterase